MKKIKFNNREIDILNTIWSTEKSLSAMDVVNLSNISKNTVHSILKKLIDKNCIRVDEIILSGKTLTRTYSRVIDREQFILQQYEDLEIESLLNHFFNSEENMNNISKIEELIEIKKKRLMKGKNRWIYLFLLFLVSFLLSNVIVFYCTSF